MTIHRLAQPASSRASRSWVASTTDFPWSRQAPTAAMTSRRPTTSRNAVGSSSSTTLSAWVDARANMTFWAMPSLKVSMDLSAQDAMPPWSKAAWTWAAVVGCPPASSASSMTSCTVKAAPRGGVEETNAKCAARRLGGILATGSEPNVTAPRLGRSSPANVRNKVDLPVPLRPSTTIALPGGKPNDKAPAPSGGWANSRASQVNSSFMPPLPLKWTNVPFR